MTSRQNRRPRYNQNRSQKRPHAASPGRATSPRTSELDAALNAALQRPTPEIADFTGFGLPDVLVTQLTAAGITRPSPIQASALADALAGRDILGRAETGSGKTLAFGLPLLARLHAGTGGRTPRGLVLVPTRELARQVTEALLPLARPLRLKIATVVGGLSIANQMHEIRQGVDIVVATPGRLIDLMERNAVSLDDVGMAVLDEADHMADLGFLPAVTRILDATPPHRQSLLFSATLDRGVERLATRYLSDPAVHAVSNASGPVEAMTHRVFRLSHNDKVTIAAEIAVRPARTLFFVRTKHGADRLAKQLTTRGVDAAAIHGNLNQNQRLRALDSFASGRTRVLVATDVAARGIHVDDVDLVVHFDPPNDHKDYLHRSGRTARAGATGTVISFVEPDQATQTARLHAAASVSPDVAVVTSGHPAVREVAASGTPITVTHVARQAPPSRPHAPRRSGRGSRRPSYGSAAR